MAKIVITIEDRPDGKVKCVSSPDFATLMKMSESGHAWTAAQGMALFALNRIWQEGKRSGPTKIILPRPRYLN